MSATNSTTNYALPIFIGTDKPAWLVDWNATMTAIDSAIKGVDTDVQGAIIDISGLSSTVASHTSSIATISGQITVITTNLNTATGNINTINSLIGNGTPTTTDQTIIGAINELDADFNGLSSRVIATATFDGVKTHGQILNDLFNSALNAVTSLSEADKLRLMLVFKRGNDISKFPFTILNLVSGSEGFEASSAYSDGTTVVYMTRNNSTIIRYKYDGTTTDYTSNVVTAGDTDYICLT